LNGATNDSLTLAEVGEAEAGAYEVTVINAAGRWAASAPAYLEIGVHPEILSVDKLEDLGRLKTNGLVGLPSGGRSLTAPESPRANGPPPVAGTVLTHILNNYGSHTQERELSLCKVLGGASRDLLITAPTNGTMVIDTLGSQIDTVLSVFTGDPALGAIGLTNVACDDNGAGDGSNSLVRFPVVQGVGYVVHVDGVKGETGVVHINWGVGQGPLPPTNLPPTLWFKLGDTLQLVSSVGLPDPPPDYQWLRGDTWLAGATNASLVINELGAGDSGTYAVVVSNRVGILTSVVAYVRVEVPLPLAPGFDRPNRRLDLVIKPGKNERVVLQTSRDLWLWRPVKTNSAPGQAMTHTVWTTNAPIEYFRCRPHR
jgi:hypothetical protein